jgi:hypothetical protein
MFSIEQLTFASAAAVIVGLGAVCICADLHWQLSLEEFAKAYFYLYHKIKGTINKFIRISLIAGTHTLFTGRYSFKKSNGKIDVVAIARILEEEHVKQHFWCEIHV